MRRASRVAASASPLWEATTVSELAEEAVVVRAEDSVDSVRDAMAQRLCATVYDEAHGRFCGLFDDQDLLSLLLRQFEGGGVQPLALDMPVKFAADVSGRNPFNAVDPGAPLSEAMRFLAAGCGRVPLVRGGLAAVPDTSHLAGLLTQQAVVSFLARKENLERLGAVANSRLSELGLGTAARTVSVEWRERSLLDALKAMHQRGVTAVPLVEGGAYKETLSLADVRTVLAGHEREPFFASCFDHVRTVRQREKGRAAAAEAALHANNRRRGLGLASGTASSRRDRAAAAASSSASSKRRSRGARGGAGRARTVQAAASGRGRGTAAGRGSQRKASSLERDEDFFRAVSAYLNPKEKGWEARPYLCSDEVTLGGALQQAAATGLQHLWVVQDKESLRVTGVVTRSDLLAAVFGASPPPTRAVAPGPAGNPGAAARVSIFQ